MKFRDLAKLYFAILLWHLVALWVGEPSYFIWLSKGLLLFVLILYALAHRKNFAPGLFGPVLLALLFSWAGDLTLEGGADFFLPGMALFALAQLAYLGAHSRLASPWHRSFLLGGGMLVLLLLLVLDQVLDLPAELAWPVRFYGALLLTHFLFALHNFRFRGRNYAWLLGAGLFLLSDLLLAYGKFKAPEEGFFSYPVMISYALAQWFLLSGFLKHSARAPQIGTT